MLRITFIDVEVDSNGRRVLDIGAVRQDGALFHMASLNRLNDFVRGTDYICGHNIIGHDQGKGKSLYT